MSNAEVILITGANTGLGYQIAKALTASGVGYQIIVAGRSLDKVHEAIRSIQSEVPTTQSKLSPLQVDVESDSSITAAASKLQTEFGRVDVLINNAGGQFDPLVKAGKLTVREAFNKAWDVNVAGTHVLTETFAPLLLKGSNPRLIFMASGTATLAGTDNTNIPVNKPANKGWPKEGFSVAGYRSAKTGMNMMMREWYRLLAVDGVKVWAISPGFLATSLGGLGAEQLKRMGAGDPAEAATFIVDVVQGKRDADVGKVIDRNGIQPW